MSIEQVKAKMSFIGGAFLDSKAFPINGVEVTIKEMKTEEIENMRTFKKEPKKVLYFEELDHGLVLGAKCNRKKLVDLVKTSSAELKGKKVTLYQDPSVKFGKHIVGAIRIK